MEQKFEGTPQAELRLEGRKVFRSDVTNDWGLRIQWQISRDGQVVGAAPARAESGYEHPDTTPGNYEIVLLMWKYVDYRKDPTTRAYVNSKYIEISNKVSYAIPPGATPAPAAATAPAAAN